MNEEYPKSGIVNPSGFEVIENRFLAKDQVIEVNRKLLVGDIVSFSFVVMHWEEAVEYSIKMIKKRAKDHIDILHARAITDIFLMNPIWESNQSNS